MSKVDIKIEGEIGKKKVRPSPAHSHPSDEFEFEFKNTEGLIFFPHPERLFVEQKPVYKTQGHKLILRLKSKGELNLDFSGGKKYPFPYAAYCEATGEFAEGSSAPVIIIEEQTK